MRVVDPGTRKAVLQPTPFAVAWTLVAVYGAALLTAAVTIAIRLARRRCHDRARRTETSRCLGSVVTRTKGARRSSRPFPAQILAFLSVGR